MCMLASGDMIVNNLAYFELQPSFKCLEEDQWRSCKSAEFCDSNIEYKIDYTSDTSLHNWVEQLSIECASWQEISRIGFYYFIGWVVGALFLPRMSEVWGRRPVYLLISAF